MKKRILKITLLIAVIAGLIYLNGGINNPFRFLTKTAQAVGDLTVDWGVPEGQPIFTVPNMAPGDSEPKTVTITNDSTSIRPVGVRGEIVTDPDNLSSAMTIVISQNGTDLYSNSLSQFFTDSINPDGIFLLNLNPSETKDILFTVTFNSSAGNPFQGKTLVFDLHIGIAVDVPTACESMKFSGQPIFGTAGNDKIKGTNKNDLIFTFEGDDTVDASNGNDCVIGGPGNDKINVSNGNDFAFGEEGNDNLDGSNGKDYLDGGAGNDTIKGSNDNDKLFGGDGTDSTTGGNGRDTCEAESEVSCEL